MRVSFPILMDVYYTHSKSNASDSFADSGMKVGLEIYVHLLLTAAYVFKSLIGGALIRKSSVSKCRA